MLEPDPNFPSWQQRKHAAELSCRCACCGASSDDADLELHDAPLGYDRRWLCVDSRACLARHIQVEPREPAQPDNHITAIVDLWAGAWLEADTRELWRTWM